MIPMPDVISAGLHSQLFAGGAAIGLVGGAMTWLRNTPTRLSRWAVSQGTVTVDVTSDDASYDWLVAWMNRLDYAKRARRLSASTVRQDSGAEHLALVPAPGEHVFRYKGRIVWLRRDRKDDDKNSSSRYRRPETLHITMIGRDQRVLRQLLQDARDAETTARSEDARLYVSIYGSWYAAGFVKDRPLESVVLREGLTDELVGSMRRFLENVEWYRAMGIPHRTGFLFYGPPGTGKSSCVVGLAGALGLDVYSVALGSKSITDEGLLSMLHGVKTRSIILLEDIDAIRAARDRGPSEDGSTADAATTSPLTPALTPATDSDSADSVDTPLTVSGLLNALDGVAAREGCIVIMTSNHADRLDPALVRPGRIDHRVLFDAADAYQIRTLFTRFYPGQEALAEELVHALEQRGQPVSPAQLQHHFVQRMHQPDRAAREPLGSEL